MNSEINQLDAESNENKEQNGNLTVKKNKKADLMAKIGCVVVAIIIWSFAKGNDTTVQEEIFSSIPVEIVNNSNFSVLSGDDVTVDVTLSGTRSAMNKISRQDIRAYVEMIDITEAGVYKFDISYDIPNGIKFERSTSDSISVYADNTSSAVVPVKTDVINVILDGEHELGINDITTDVDKITVTGPEKIISKIQYAVLTADLDHRLLTGTVIYSGRLSVVDSEGNNISNSYVKLSTSDVTATIPVYKYREVPITVKYKYGYFNSQNCDAKISPKSIKVKGEAGVVDSLVIEYEIDEKKVTKNAEFSFKIELPEGVKNLSSDNSAIVSLSLKNLSTKELNVKNIEIINPEGASAELLTSSIKIIVYGKASVLQGLTADKVRAVVDLSASKGISGIVEEPVSFEFDGEYAQKVFESGVYSVSVKIDAG